MAEREKYHHICICGGWVMRRRNDRQSETEGLQNRFIAYVTI